MGKVATGTLTMVTAPKPLKCACKKSQWVLISELVTKANLTASVAPVFGTGGKLNLMCSKCKKKTSVSYANTRERTQILRLNNVSILKSN